MKKNESFDNNSQFVISYELISLLEWILEHGDDQLKTIIQTAMQSNQLKNTAETTNLPASAAYPLEEIQAIITHFFELCDTLVAEIKDEQSRQQAIAQNLLPTIDKIDHQACDNTILQSSISNTTAKLEKKPCDSKKAKELLFREILKQWKPRKKQVIN